MINRLKTFHAVLLILVVVNVVQAQSSTNDWPWWRGPNLNGIANGSAPVQWNETANVVWKAPISGRGHSSPTVVGDRIYMATANEREQVQSVLALDRKTGKQLWKTDVNQGGFPRIHNKNTHATQTVACTGDRLFITFLNHDRIQALALDLNGKVIWEKNLGAFRPKAYKYGYAASPFIYKSNVIIAADCDTGSNLVALDQSSGQVKWKTQRPAKLSWSSPVVAKIAGREQLLLSGGEQVASYDPSSGRSIWTVPGATTMATCGTMVWEGNLVFASGGYPKPETVCIRADSGEVVWKNNVKCYEQSMLIKDGYLYAVTDRGVAYCWRASDGNEQWVQRLSGPISSSPILAGGNIYQTNEQGTTYVFKANPNKFEPVARNQLGNEGFATPTICGGKIYIRAVHGNGAGRKEMLYCIGGA